MNTNGYLSCLQDTNFTEHGPRPINVEELRLIVKQIEAHPETWYQRTWAKQESCGTSFCVAGHAVYRAGYDVLWGEMLGDTSTATDCAHPESQAVVSISVMARELLGLTEYQSGTLFNGSNSLDDIKAVVEALAVVEEAS
jgi:hypothetical protein